MERCLLGLVIKIESSWCAGFIFFRYVDKVDEFLFIFRKV